jgi:hypothetical protein
MAEALITIVSLIDTALKAREYTLDFIHAPQEQKDLVSEMKDLRALLEELHKRIIVNPSSRMLPQMYPPLGAFKTTMEQCTKKLQPGRGPVSKFSKRLTWTLWDKKEANEYLNKFEQFKSLLNSWLILDIWFVSLLSECCVLISNFQGCGRTSSQWLVTTLPRVAYVG